MWKPVFDDVTEENIDHAIEQGNELYDSRYRILHINASDNQVWIIAERGRANNRDRISDVFEKSKSKTLNRMTNEEINDLEIFGLGFSLSDERTNTKIDADELIKEFLLSDDNQSGVVFSFSNPPEFVDSLLQYEPSERFKNKVHVIVDGENTKTLSGQAVYWKSADIKDLNEKGWNFGKKIYGVLTSSGVMHLTENAIREVVNLQNQSPPPHALRKQSSGRIQSRSRLATASKK